MASILTNEMTATFVYIRHWISADGRKKKCEWMEMKRWRADTATEKGILSQIAEKSR